MNRRSIIVNEAFLFIIIVKIRRLREQQREVFFISINNRHSKEHLGVLENVCT